MFNTQLFTEIEEFAADFYPGSRLILKPFFYPVTFPTIAVNASQFATLKINGNAGFILTHIVGKFATIANVADARLQIVDSGTQEALFNSPAPLLNYVQVGAATLGTNDNSLGMFKNMAANSNQVLTISAGANAAGSIVTPTLTLFGVQVYVLG